MKQLLNRLVNVGTIDNTKDKQFVSSTNWAAIIAWGVTFPYIFIYFSIDVYSLALVNTVCLFLYPITFYFNKVHMHKIAKIFFIITGYSHVAALSIYYPPAGGYGLYFYLMPVISVFIFSREEKLLIFTGIGVFFPFYFITQYLYTVLPPVEVPESIATFLFHLAVSLVLLFIISFVYAFRSSSLFFQDKLDEQKQFLQTLLNSQEQLIITTDGKSLRTANETFLDFFAVESVEDFMNEYDAKCVCDTFNTNAPEGYLQISMGRESWVDYVISRSFGEIHKAMISVGGTDFIFSVSAAKLPGDEGLKSAVFTNITEMENAKNLLESIHEHTRESIEYASLIQIALIPDNKSFQKYFQDHLVIWHPKDVVGGDIYLFEELRNEDECLLMVIDCTGHGVPGAFVTMLVKAIERQITSRIKHSDEVVSPANILSVFNKSMKHLLKQETIESVSNAGFDGGIIYYNKKENILKFAGAETPLFYIEDDELKTIKGNRHSIGYKKSDINFEFKEHTIEVKEGMKFYLTTDGYLDQNGGEKSFPFGKKRFKALIEKYHNESMADQQESFLAELDNYQDEEERNDDVTLIGFKI